MDLSLLLDCIALVETGNNDAAVGKSGERSKYQIGEKVWNQNVMPAIGVFDTSLDRFRIEPQNFIKHCHGDVARVVGMRHIAWLHTQIGPSVFAIALAWHVGLENWRAARFQLPQRYYGERVRNLYNDRINK